MRILVYGAGVLGSRYAASLQKAGNDVTLLARGERLQQIREHGIILEAINTGQTTCEQVPVVESLQPEVAYDWVLVLMRSNQIRQILPILAANHHTPNVLFLGNNIHGPGEMIQALGRGRVLMGFAGAGGTRNGPIIRYIHSEKNVTYAGELDGQITPRLEEIRSAFKNSEFPLKIEKDILSWLRTHVALISPMAYAIYMCGGDNYRLARMQDAQVLLVRAVRESFKALKSLGYPLIPKSMGGLAGVPEPLLVSMLRRMLNSTSAEIGLAGHANAARDEMEYLADGLWKLVQSSGVPAPSLERLYAYRSPDQPALAENSRQIEIHHREMLPVIGGLLLAAGFLGWIAGKAIKLLRRKSG